MKKDAYNNSLNILKFILSLLVVQIHIGIFYSYNRSLDFFLKNLVGRYAVPLFFMASSYLLFKKINKKNLFCEKNLDIYKKYFKRLIIIYFIISLIYYIFLNSFFNGNCSILSFVFQFFTIGIYRQLWFFPALIYSILLLIILLKNFSIKTIIKVFTIIYIIILLLVPYNNLFSFLPRFSMDNLPLYRNFLTIGCLYSSIGAYFAFNQSKTNYVKKDLIFLVIYLILSVIEFSFLNLIGCQYYAFQICIIGVCIHLFKIILNNNIKMKRKLSDKLRIYSIFIFLFHTLINLLIKQFIAINSIFEYILTIIICLFIAELYLMLKNKLHIVSST